MFAGAAREAVFSNPDVIRRVNSDFVPVALKAALVNNPPDGDEGRLYREIGRSKPAPQGICVANSAGKVLDWALMFDDDASVLAFLDHAAKRFREFPHAKRPVVAERYMKFPSAKLPDVADTVEVLPATIQHTASAPCPARPRFRSGTLVAHVFGRALGLDGKPVADTVRQEQYVEDRFELSVESQELLAKKLGDSGTERFKMPDQLAREIVSHAFLGQLDVNPLGSLPARRDRGDLKAEFWVDRASENATAPVRLRIEGRSEVAGGQDASRPDGRSDGRLWEHEVRLTWQGFIEMDDKRVSRLLLAARGSEKLKWGNTQITGPVDVARLPGGHPIDLACDVRYGIIGEPVSGDELIRANDGVARPESAKGVARGGNSANTPFDDSGRATRPREAADEDPARHLMGALGPQFAIFLDKVQDDLAVSDDQKRALSEMKRGAAQGFEQFTQDSQNAPEDDRAKKRQEFREGANKMVGEALGQLLKPEQQKRLRQIILQQEGLFALGNPEIAAEIKFTGEQERRSLMRIIQETQTRFQSLQQKAQSSSDPAAVQRESVKIRNEQEAKIAALLSEKQKEQWKVLLGKRLSLEE